jgi:hypothetical protein
MAAGQYAYGQTDVMNDPNYIRAMLQRNPHDPLRQAAEKNLEYLQHQQTLQQSERNLQENIAARRQTVEEGRADRAQRAGETAQYHQDQLNQRKAEQLQRAAEAGDRSAQRVLAALPFINIMNYGKDAPAIQKKILDQFLSQQGVPTTVTPTVDATTQAAQRAAGALGKPVAQPAGQAPTTAPQQTPRSGITPLSAAPSTLAALQGQPEAGAAQPTGAPQPAERPPTSADLFAQGKAQAQTQGTPYVEGGQVYGGPKGQDYNVSTGEWMPSSLQGTINGKPAGQAIAEGAVRTGITPESRTGLAALRQMSVERGIAGGNPPPNEAMTPTPVGQPQVAQGAPPTEPPPVLGGGPSPAGSLFSGGQGANALVGPQPNPTPAGTPAPSIVSQAATAFQNAPITEPTPAETPPAQPTPQPSGPTPEQLAAEEARRKQQLGQL